jgi:hypothetical protein
MHRLKARDAPDTDPLLDRIARAHSGRSGRSLSVGTIARALSWPRLDQESRSVMVWPGLVFLRNV